MPNTVRRTLTLIQLIDGVWVVESKKPLDHPRTTHVSEAKFSLLNLFKEKTSVYDPKEKAKRALREVFYYLQGEDLEAKPTFTRDGVEWHPIIARMDQYHLDSTLFENKKKKTGWSITPLPEHRFAEKLQRLVTQT